MRLFLLKSLIMIFYLIKNSLSNSVNSYFNEMNKFKEDTFLKIGQEWTYKISDEINKSSVLKDKIFYLIAEEIHLNGLSLYDYLEEIYYHLSPNDIDNDNVLIFISLKPKKVVIYTNHKQISKDEKREIINNMKHYLVKEEYGDAIYYSILEIKKKISINKEKYNWRSYLLYYFFGCLSILTLKLGLQKIVRKKKNFLIPLDNKIDKLVRLGKKVKSGNLAEMECCPICLESMDELIKLSITNCNHIYHTKCLNDWRKKSNCCPVCRSSICMERELPKNKAPVNQYNFKLFRNSFSNFTMILLEEEVKYIDKYWNKEFSFLFGNKYILNDHISYHKRNSNDDLILSKEYYDYFENLESNW